MSDTVFEVSNLRLAVEHRTFGSDGGPALRVYTASDAQPVQLLRFDCFDNDPHYHYEPSGKNEMHHLDRAQHPDPVGWALAQVREKLPEMIRHAGHPDVAAAVDVGAVHQVLPLVEQAMRERP